MKRRKAKREVRRIRHKSAWIVINGSATSECEVLDISQTGAKIMSNGTTAIPASFELAFVQGDQKRQTCEVVWRRGKMLGIKFVR
jgi:PilZ domain